LRELCPSELTDRIVERARSLGASVVGVADVEALKTSPSHRISPRIGMGLEARWRDTPDEAVPAEVDWRPDALSAVVIGVSHPTSRKQLDWYDGKGTPGNRVLIGIARELSEWLEHDISVTTHRPPYFIESGGVFMKDAAVLAGLGSVGRNNLVITPEYGPRVRWRVLLLDRAAKATGQLPGTDGSYDRVTCNTKMAQDIEDAAGALAAGEDDRRDLADTMNAFEEAVMALPPGGGETRYGVKYCRRCELSCPVGR
jgi:epoxyqueuosine reductase